MKVLQYILLTLVLASSFSLSAQNRPSKSTTVVYFDKDPNNTSYTVTTYNSEFSIDRSQVDAYIWNADSNRWDLLLKRNALRISNDTLFTSDSTFLELPSAAPQTLSIVGDTAISISGGNTVNLPEAAPQTLSIVGDTAISISGGNTVNLPSSGGGGSGTKVWRDLVEDFGADNTGATNIYTEWLAAMTSDFPIYIPPGTYLLDPGGSTQIEVPVNKVVHGAGMTQTTITLANYSIFSIKDYATVRYLKIDQSVNNSDGVFIEDFAVADRVHFDSFSGTALEVFANSVHTKVINCKMTNSQSGFENGGTNTVVENCLMEGNSFTDMNLQRNGSTGYFNGCTFNSPQYFASNTVGNYTFTNCTFNNVSNLRLQNRKATYDKCVFNAPILIEKSEIRFTDCTFLADIDEGGINTTNSLMTGCIFAAGISFIDVAAGLTKVNNIQL